MRSVTTGKEGCTRHSPARPTAQETNSGAAQASDVDLDVTDQRAPTARGTRGDDAPAVGDELSTDDDVTRAHRTSQGCTLANDASGADALLGLGGMLALLARRHRRAH